MKIEENKKHNCNNECKFINYLHKEKLNKIMKDIRIKECLYPNHKCCSNKIVKAHSIQNSKILKKISDNGKIYMPIGKDFKPFNGEMTIYGRNEASTFTGFCAYHDKEVFKEIEDNNFNYTIKKKFLYVYRAFALEYYIKRQYIQFEKKIIEKCNFKNFSNLEISLRGLELSEKDLLYDKKKFDKALLKEKYNLFNYIVWEFKESAKFAASGFFSLVKDLNGNRMQNLNNEKHIIKHIFITIFPEESKTYVIFSWMKKNNIFFKRYIKQMNSLNIKQRKNYINHLIPLELENIVINPKAWNKLNYEQKDEFYRLFRAHSSIDYDNICKDMLEDTTYDLFSL